MKIERWIHRVIMRHKQVRSKFVQMGDRKVPTDAFVKCSCGQWWMIGERVEL